MGQNRLTLMVTVALLAGMMFVTTPAHAQACDPETDPLCVDYTSTEQTWCIGPYCFIASNNDVLQLVYNLLGFVIQADATPAPDVAPDAAPTLTEAQLTTSPTPTITPTPETIIITLTPAALFPTVQPYYIQTVAPRPSPTAPVIPTYGAVVVPPFNAPTVGAPTPRPPAPSLNTSGFNPTPPPATNNSFFGTLGEMVAQVQQYAMSIYNQWSVPLTESSDTIIHGDGQMPGIIGTGAQLTGFIERAGIGFQLLRAVQWYAPNIWIFVLALLVGVGIVVGQSMMKLVVAIWAVVMQLILYVWETAGSVIRLGR